jgi:hypothetical protein
MSQISGSSGGEKRVICRLLPNTFVLTGMCPEEAPEGDCSVRRDLADTRAVIHQREDIIITSVSPLLLPFTTSYSVILYYPF